MLPSLEPGTLFGLWDTRQHLIRTQNGTNFLILFTIKATFSAAEKRLLVRSLGGPGLLLMEEVEATVVVKVVINSNHSNSNNQDITTNSNKIVIGIQETIKVTVTSRCTTKIAV